MAMILEKADIQAILDKMPDNTQFFVVHGQFGGDAFPARFMLHVCEGTKTPVCYIDIDPKNIEHRNYPRTRAQEVKP